MNENTDFSKMTVTELKALAFDLMAEGQRINNLLQTIQRELANRQTQAMHQIQRPAPSTNGCFFDLQPLRFNIQR